MDIVKRNTLKWFSYVERIGSEEFVNKVYESELRGPNRRGRPLERWKDRVESTWERGIFNGTGILEQARRECWDRERWRLFCCGQPLGGCSWRERGIRAKD